jgi:hypothetical protein
VAIAWIENVYGATSPWRVASEDHLDALSLPRHFLLKNFRVGQDRSRYLEYVALRIAAELDIGSPRPELLPLSEEFVEIHRTLRSPPSGIERVVIGPHLGVPWYDDATVLARLPYGKIHNLHSEHQPAGILAADTLLQNPDRHRGNVLVRTTARGKRILVPIDWGLCFRGFEPVQSVLRRIADERTIYVGSADMRPNIGGPSAFEGIMRQLEQLASSTSHIRALIEEVPEEWQVPERWMTASYEHVIRRIEVALDVLLHINADRTMPEWQLDLPVSGDR